MFDENGRRETNSIDRNCLSGGDLGTDGGRRRRVPDFTVLFASDDSASAEAVRSYFETHYHHNSDNGYLLNKLHEQNSI